MNVEQLIKALEALPKDAEVYHLWDGEARTGINHVWLSRGGDVVTADYGMVCYSEETRPADAPTKEQDRRWKSPRNLNEDADA